MARKYRILFVGSACPPGKAGSNIVMKNILDCLHSGAWRFITMNREEGECGPEFEEHVLRISSRMSWLRRASLIGTVLNTCRYYFRARKFASEFKPTVIISSYPAWDFMILGAFLATSLKIPYIPYLHDTIAESFTKSKFYFLARWIQAFLFSRAAAIMVMSEGIASLYKSKYAIEAIAVEHIYLEKIDDTLPCKEDRSNDAFWAGSVYSINRNAVKRVSDAVTKLGMRMTFTDRMSKASPEKLGITGDKVDIVHLPTRQEYLQFLHSRGFAVLALDDKEESSMGDEELATIFPTKTPEYLAAGLPILVHCPESYFLAQFFKKHQCGIVVSEKSTEALMAAIRRIREDSEEVMTMRRNALNAAQIFSPDAVMKKFYEVIDSCAKGGKKEGE